MEHISITLHIKSLIQVAASTSGAHLGAAGGESSEGVEAVAGPFSGMGKPKVDSLATAVPNLIYENLLALGNRVVF